MLRWRTQHDRTNLGLFRFTLTYLMEVNNKSPKKSVITMTLKVASLKLSMWLSYLWSFTDKFQVWLELESMELLTLEFPLNLLKTIWSSTKFVRFVTRGCKRFHQMIYSQHTLIIWIFFNAFCLPWLWAMTNLVFKHNNSSKNWICSQLHLKLKLITIITKSLDIKDIKKMHFMIIAKTT